MRCLTGCHPVPHRLPQVASQAAALCLTGCQLVPHRLPPYASRLHHYVPRLQPCVSRRISWTRSRPRAARVPRRSCCMWAVTRPTSSKSNWVGSSRHRPHVPAATPPAPHGRPVNWAAGGRQRRCSSVRSGCRHGGLVRRGGVSPPRQLSYLPDVTEAGGRLRVVRRDRETDGRIRWVGRWVGRWVDEWVGGWTGGGWWGGHTDRQIVCVDLSFTGTTCQGTRWAPA